MRHLRSTRPPIKNLETQIGQISTQIANMVQTGFSGNTFYYLKSKNRVHELSAERLTTFIIEEYASKWDKLKAQVDEALENLKEVGTESVEANREAMRVWFVEILYQMDLVKLRRNSIRQLDAPKTPMVDDLEGFSALPLFIDFPSPRPEDLFVRRELFGNPTLRSSKMKSKKNLLLKRRSKRYWKLNLVVLLQNKILWKPNELMW